MNKKIKKIMATSLLAMTATTAIGCATSNSKTAQKINNGVNDFVSSINKLDYVDTNKTNSTLGKIVSAATQTNFLSKVSSTANIENTITRPTDRTDNFKLYVLSDSPYITLSSDDNTMSLSVQFSTEKIENVSDDINEKINKLILKRAILMVYVNEIYNGNVNLTDDSRKAINAYVNVIKENASFLNGNRGMVKNQLDMASNLISKQNQDNIVNYYIIKSGEALEIRSNKIDSTISAIDSIISILETNLTSSSCYYQNSLSNAYNNMITNLENSNLANENSKLAKEIAESINMINTKNETINQKPVVIDNNSTKQNITNNNQNNTTLNNTNNSLNNNLNNTQNNVVNNNIQNNQNRNNINNRLNNNQHNISTLQQNEINNQTNNNSLIQPREYLNEQNRINNIQKTQNRANNSVNQYNNNNICRNCIDNNQNLTPSERARMLRRQAQNNNVNTQTNQRNTTPFNPTTNPKNVQPIERQTTSLNTLESRNPMSITTSNTTQENRVSRVPYRASTTKLS